MTTARDYARGVNPRHPARYATAYAMGSAQRGAGEGYRNPFQPHEDDFRRFAEGWSHKDAELWEAKRAALRQAQAIAALMT